MVTTRGGEHVGSSARSKAHLNQPATDVRRSKRNIAATPAGTVDSPDIVLNLQFDSAAATKPVGNKSKARISKAPSTRKKSKLPSKPIAEINATLSPACLIEIFKRCSNKECLYVLPLVCKYWAEILRAPSAAWETLEISSYREMHQYNPGFIPMLGYGKFLNWITPRAEGITNLTLNYMCYGDPRHGECETRDIAGAHFSSILKMVAPTLKTLKLLSICQGGYGFDLKWSVLKDLAGAAKTLTSLELTFIKDGQLTYAHVEDLKLFKNLKRLGLSWRPSPEATTATAPIGNAAALASKPTSSSVPFNLFELTQLKYLSLDSELLTGTVSENIQELICLTELKLTGTNISKIEAWPYGLKKLSLSGSLNGQEIINKGFWNSFSPYHTRLKEVDLSGCNIKRLNGTLLSDEVDSVDQLDHLGILKLNVSHNPLGDLNQSNSIYSLHGLVELNLSHCGLSVLPEGAAPNWDGVEIFNLDGNSLVDLPRDVEHMDSLKEFSASRNNFPAIPEALKKIEFLAEIDISFSNYLEISKSISEWLVGMKNLKDICLVKYGDRYQASSLLWLQEAEKELSKVGRESVLVYDQKAFKEK